MCVCVCVCNVCVLCAYVFVYTCISDYFTEAVNCTETHTKCSRCPLPQLFQAYIKIPSLFFSFKKLLTLIITFFKSDDIAFLFGILTACDTRCH